MPQAENAKAILSPHEMTVLLSLYDWEHRPYLSLPDSVELKLLPHSPGKPCAWSPVPQLLLECMHSQDKIDVATCINTLVKLELVERSKSRTYRTGSWKLRDGRVLRADYQEQTQELPSSHPAARKGPARVVHVSLEIKGQLDSKKSASFDGGCATAFPCYSLTQNGLDWARRYLAKGIPDDVLVLISKMVEVSPEPPHRVYWGTRRTTSDAHHEVQMELKLKYQPARSFLFVHAPDLGWDEARAERTLSKAMDLGLVECPPQDQYIEQLMSGMETRVSQCSRSVSLTKYGMTLAGISPEDISSGKSMDGETKTTLSRRSRRGRRPMYDPVKDDKLQQDWKASEFKRIEEFAAARGLKPADVHRAIDRVEARRRSEARQES